MPMDAAGNRADIVMDGNSTMNRMNVGRSYEQYITASARDTTLKIACDLGVTDNKAKDLPKQLEQLEVTNPDLVDKVWQYLMGFYSIVTPKTSLWFRDGEYKDKRTNHLAHVVRDGIFMYKPPDDEPEFENIVLELERHYRPVYGPVTYTGNSGIPCRTVMPVRIGEVYFILLEKIADDWAAISSGKWQHFGVLSQMTNVDKYAQPYRGQAVRAWGESEIRIAISYAGGKVTADILDRNNNPITHKHILNSILTAEKPTNIYSAVDRNVVPLGGARPLQLAKHILQCSGLEFEYSNFIPTSHAPVAIH